MPPAARERGGAACAIPTKHTTVRGASLSAKAGIRGINLLAARLAARASRALASAARWAQLKRFILLYPTSVVPHTARAPASLVDDLRIYTYSLMVFSEDPRERCQEIASRSDISELRKEDVGPIAISYWSVLFTLCPLSPILLCYSEHKAVVHVLPTNDRASSQSAITLFLLFFCSNIPFVPRIAIYAVQFLHSQSVGAGGCVAQMATGASRVTAIQLSYGSMGAPYPLFYG